MKTASAFPFTFELFGQRFHYHFIFETLAFFVGIRLYYTFRKQINDPITEQNRLWIMLGAMLGALLGSRVVAVLETPEVLKHLNFQIIYENKTIIGGLLGGLFGVEAIKKIIGVNIASGDIYVTPIIVALFIGRMGCFSMGIDEPTYGITTTFFTGMDLGDGQLRHPIMLYEIFFLIVLLFIFYFIRKKPLPNGDRFKLLMLLYFTFRFFIEFLKPYHALFLHLSSIQWSAVFIWGYYFKFIGRMANLSMPKPENHGQY